MYVGASAYGELTASFEIRIGVGQGCVLSSTILCDRMGNGHLSLSL